MRTDVAIHVAGAGQLPRLLASRIGRAMPGHRVSWQPTDAPADRIDAADLLTVPGGGVVVAVSESWDEDWLARWNEYALGAGLRLVTCHIEYAEAVLGPLVAGEPGCFECWRRRRWSCREHREGDRLACQRARTAGTPSPWLTPGARAAIGWILPHRLVGQLAGTVPALTAYHLNLLTLTGSSHQFLPDPACHRCGGVAADSADPARLVLRSRPKAGRHRYRLTSLGGLREVAASSLVDPYTGLVQSVGSILDHDRTALAQAEMRTPDEDRTEYAFGRGHNYPDSKTAAVLEALERHAGHRPRGVRTTVTGSYAALKADAVDPAAFGLHSAEDYAASADLEPYSADLDYAWVWGYSFREARPVLVPEQLAYYRTHPKPRFVYEVSNGCALGACPEEAILHGLLEVLERDSFLLTWYARRPPVPLDLASHPSPRLALAVQRMEAAGYRVVVGDTTTEFGIPCVWATLVNRRREPPYALCAAGAHFRYEAAVEAALGELAVSVTIRERHTGQDTERAIRMLADPTRVRAMEDHALCYSVPEAFSRLEFLFDGPAGVPLERRVAAPEIAHDDLATDVRAVIDRVLGHGLDVIVVDQTTREQRRLDLCTYKVLVPGTLPMTFGHHRRRLTGLDRVLSPPAPPGATGWAPGSDEINPYPHPFP